MAQQGARKDMNPQVQPNPAKNLGTDSEITDRNTRVGSKENEREEKSKTTRTPFNTIEGDEDDEDAGNDRGLEGNR